MAIYEERFNEWWANNKEQWDEIALDNGFIPESGWYLVIDSKYYIYRGS